MRMFCSFRPAVVPGAGDGDGATGKGGLRDPLRLRRRQLVTDGGAAAAFRKRAGARGLLARVCRRAALPAGQPRPDPRASFPVPTGMQHRVPTRFARPLPAALDLVVELVRTLRRIVASEHGRAVLPSLLEGLLVDLAAAAAKVVLLLELAHGLPNRGRCGAFGGG